MSFGRVLFTPGLLMGASFFQSQQENASSQPKIKVADVSLCSSFFLPTPPTKSICFFSATHLWRNPPYQWSSILRWNKANTFFGAKDGRAQSRDVTLFGRSFGKTTAASPHISKILHVKSVMSIWRREKIPGDECLKTVKKISGMFCGIFNSGFSKKLYFNEFFRWQNPWGWDRY